MQVMININVTNKKQKDKLNYKEKEWNNFKDKIIDGKNSKISTKKYKIAKLIILNSKELVLKELQIVMGK